MVVEGNVGVTVFVDDIVEEIDSEVVEDNADVDVAVDDIVEEIGSEVVEVSTELDDLEDEELVNGEDEVVTSEVEDIEETDAVSVVFNDNDGPGVDISELDNEGDVKRPLDELDTCGSGVSDVDDWLGVNVFDDCEFCDFDVEVSIEVATAAEEGSVPVFLAR
ncbi:hypothetical protein GGI15_002961 [Coemansia interrupta]|uniref:Uncharacterized protein n=1 Tax=Coemansia interrupta TaxID=1126814 RepID=A0A9W8HIK7_9FUNG|nr:hypothetical protein GGI15_002961 [Coemansia interrupta]